MPSIQGKRENQGFNKNIWLLGLSFECLLDMQGSKGIFECKDISTDDFDMSHELKMLGMLWFILMFISDYLHW